MWIKTALSFAWKVLLCGLAYTVGSMAGGAVTTALGMTSPSLPEGIDGSTLGTWMMVAGLTVGLALGPLARGMGGRRLARWLILAAFIYVCAVVTTAIEAAIFTQVGGTGRMLLTLLPSCLLCAAAALLFRKGGGGESFGAGLERFFAARSAQAWAWRLAVAVAAFPLIYFVFGAMVGPFVVEYYREQAYLLTLPSLRVILAVQVLRSVLFLAVSIPVLVMWSGSRARLALALGFALFVLVGLMNLLQAAWLPLSLRIPHGIEILADSMVHAAVLVALLVPKGEAVPAPQAAA